MTDSRNVVRARAFAVTAHGDQKYGEHPYVFHLDAVARILEPYGEEARIIGYLHDVLEDTEVPRDVLGREFGDNVLECVALVTDEMGGNRKDRKAKTNAKLAKVTDKAMVALIVKAADRLANLRMSAASGGSILQMYRREHPEFKAAAFRPGLCDDLWEEMERVLAGVKSE